jgi:hypothetical protein
MISLEGADWKPTLYSTIIIKQDDLDKKVKAAMAAQIGAEAFVLTSLNAPECVNLSHSGARPRGGPVFRNSGRTWGVVLGAVLVI